MDSLSEITFSFGQMLWIFGFIASFAAAGKILAPVFKISGRVSTLEKKQAKIFEKIDEFKVSVDEMKEESKTADRLIVRAMVEIVDNRVTNNNIENLKSTKKDLMAFLQEN